MMPDFLEMLLIFLIFYMFRYLVETDYRSTKKRHIAIEIIITSVLAFVLMSVFGRI